MVKIKMGCVECEIGCVEITSLLKFSELVLIKTFMLGSLRLSQEVF